ncbi:MAG TPA: hypothetical protein VHS31_04610 [Tepidisphaeraceae bacterium]|jgi:hypothetical protein|nr:hypothetical protein [Tepidisphaeraceae bacterium]
MRRSFLFVMLPLLVFVMGIPSQESSSRAAMTPIIGTATKTGWWIKVRTDRTEATSIDFQIGTKREDRESWRAWHSSDPTEFDVPDKYLKVAHLYIQATANPQGKKAWLCIMYEDHGVQHIDTDNSNEQDKNQTDSDGDCN